MEYVDNVVKSFPIEGKEELFMQISEPKVSPLLTQSLEIIMDRKEPAYIPNSKIEKQFIWKMAFTFEDSPEESLIESTIELESGAIQLLAINLVHINIPFLRVISGSVKIDTLTVFKWPYVAIPSLRKLHILIFCYL